MIGPKHYSGWTCNECKFLTETTHFYCFEPTVTSQNIDNRIENRMHTPTWCPHLRYAIMIHNLENY